MTTTTTIATTMIPATTTITIATATTITKSYPKGCAATSFVPCQCNTWETLSKLKGNSLPRKIVVTSKSPVGDISVVTLIRTDTTLDHSQKAEKVWSIIGSYNCHPRAVARRNTAWCVTMNLNAYV